MMRDKQPARRFSSGTRPRLVLGGLAAVSATLTACDTAVEPAQFTSIQACTQAGYEQRLCEAGFNAAVAEQQKTAPRFNSLASCEAEWGTSSCGPLTTPAIAGSSYTTGGSVFVPLVAGFVLSQAMQQRYYDRGDIDFDYYGGYYRGGSPIYRSRSGSTVTLSNSGGRMISSPVNVNTHTVARSGFGGMGRSRGGFGG
jgi:uncharacterized protein YgiB involved in biofilm formation